MNLVLCEIEVQLYVVTYNSKAPPICSTKWCQIHKRTIGESTKNTMSSPTVTIKILTYILKHTKQTIQGRRMIEGPCHSNIDNNVTIIT